MLRTRHEPGDRACQYRSPLGARYCTLKPIRRWNPFPDGAISRARPALSSRPDPPPAPERPRCLVQCHSTGHDVPDLWRSHEEGQRETHRSRRRPWIEKARRSFTIIRRRDTGAIGTPRIPTTPVGPQASITCWSAPDAPSIRTPPSAPSGGAPTAWRAGRARSGRRRPRPHPHRRFTAVPRGIAADTSAPRATRPATLAGPDGPESLHVRNVSGLADLPWRAPRSATPRARPAPRRGSRGHPVLDQTRRRHRHELGEPTAVPAAHPTAGSCSTGPALDAPGAPATTPAGRVLA